MVSQPMTQSHGSRWNSRARRVGELPRHLRRDWLVVSHHLLLRVKVPDVPSLLLINVQHVLHELTIIYLAIFVVVDNVKHPFEVFTRQLYSQVFEPDPKFVIIDTTVFVEVEISAIATEMVNGDSHMCTGCCCSPENFPNQLGLVLNFVRDEGEQFFLGTKLMVPIRAASSAVSSFIFR